MTIRHLLGEIFPSLFLRLQRRMHDLIHASLDHVGILSLAIHPRIEPVDDLHRRPRSLFDTQVECPEGSDAEPGFHVSGHGAEVHTVVPEPAVGFTSEFGVLNDEDAAEEIRVSAKVPKCGVSLARMKKCMRLTWFQNASRYLHHA